MTNDLASHHNRLCGLPKFAWGLGGLPAKTRVRRPAPLGGQATGMSLLELLIAITILSTLIATGLPLMNKLITKTRSTSYANDLASALNLTRKLAYQSGVSHGICGTNDGATCNGLTDWSKGWLIFRDDNGSGTYAAGDTLILVRKIDEGTHTVLHTAPLGYTAPPALILFSPKLGRSDGSIDTLFTVCAPGINSSTVSFTVVGKAKASPSGSATSTPC